MKLVPGNSYQTPDSNFHFLTLFSNVSEHSALSVGWVNYHELSWYSLGLAELFVSIMRVKSDSVPGIQL